MDKHEFNIKVDQIKKMVSKGDFETAMKIADTIDWRRVRNANLLSMISSVYEKNAEYQEAKDILLIAFERAPIGKRLLYKLTQLALKEGDITEAESYYREFCELAGDDSRQDILRYLILKEKGAPIEQLIHSLESYTSIELDEKWLYELADLYHQAGKEDECVRTCDKIMLMFGLGQYVDKAMELKLQYAPLTKYQMDLVENRDKYEEKLRQIEQNGVNAVISREQTVSKEEAEAAAAARRGQVAAMEAKSVAQPPVSRYADAVSSSVVSDYADTVSQPAVPAYTDVHVPTAAPPTSSVHVNAAGQSSVSVSGETEEIPAADAYREDGKREKEDEMVSNIAASFAAATAEPQSVSVTPEEKLEVSMKEAEVEASLAKEMSKISMDSYQEEPVREKTRVLQNVKDLKKAGEQPEKTKVLSEIRHIQAAKPAEEQKPPFNHFMVESRSLEQGLSIAVEALKKAHQILDYKHPAVKISGGKLNQKGILASASKLIGKDLIVENAGDLCDAMLEELDKLLAEDKSQILVILVDNPRQIEGIRRINPSLADKFHVVTSADDTETVLQRGAEWKKNHKREPEESVSARPPVQAAAERPTVSQTETAAARQSVGQTETTATRQSVGQTETAAVQAEAVRRQAAARTEAAVRQTIPQDEAAAARAGAGEAAAVRQDIPRTEVRPVRQTPSRTEAAPSNIVQLRAAQETYSDEHTAEQSRNATDEPDDGRIMDLDEFAQYCCHYASQIDCNISGKSMLALYERIEIMEEEGIALTKTAAEDLIEEAADRAEKPSIGKRLAGLFSSKYDKEGLLILKEEHFI